MEQDQLDKIVNQLRQGPGETKDSDLYRAFQYFVSEDGIRGKTKITPAQRNMLWVFGVWHKKHPNWGLKAASDDLALLFISQEGESRKGMIELFKGLLRNRQEQMGGIENLPTLPGIKGRDF